LGTKTHQKLEWITIHPHIGTDPSQFSQLTPIFTKHLHTVWGNFFIEELQAIQAGNYGISFLFT
jgi:hypothetical protein